MKCDIHLYDFEDDLDENIYGSYRDDPDKSHDIYINKAIDAICEGVWNMNFVLSREEITRLGNKIIEMGRAKEVTNLEDAW